MDLGGSNDAENPLTQAANSVAGAARTASISARRAVGMQVPVEVQTCVDINQCVGCTRHRVDGEEDDAMIQQERAVKF